VGWVILPAGEKHAWKHEWLRLLRHLRPAIPATMMELTRLRRSTPDEENGETAIAVRNLRSGATAAVNDRQVFPAASLAKVPILYEVYRQLEAGKLRRDTPVTITGDAIADGSGVLQAREGDRLTVDELLDLAVEVSDNTAARVLMREVGGVDAINRAMADLGLSHTRLYSDSRPNTTTAGEMALLLAAVAARAGSPQAAATPTTNSLAALLVLPQAQAWLTLGVPRGVTVAHKSGQLPNLRHDAAVVYAARGPYIVVGLTDHLADQGDGEAFLAHLSRAVYEYFAK
jgi:beta-lactamase class A